MATRIRRWEGLRPSRTSGIARLTITLISRQLIEYFNVMECLMIGNDNDTPPPVAGWYLVHVANRFAELDQYDSWKICVLKGGLKK